ncbi:MAG: hypothetical protein HOI95_00955, partial [Chromatiales bacterium]|nr:hypothetical protein [Chromatiales bacterium]
MAKVAVRALLPYKSRADLPADEGIDGLTICTGAARFIGGTMEGLAADESTCIDDDTLLKWLTLMRLLGWFSGASRELLRPDKGADELLNDGLAESSRLGAAKLAQARSAAQVDLTACRGLGIGIVPLSHPSYPASLKQTVGCPVVLFALGDLSAITRPSVAIVGSRRPTPAGRNLAGEFGSDL